METCAFTGLMRGGLTVDSEPPYPTYYRESMPLRGADPAEVVSACRWVAMASYWYRTRHDPPAS